jgi:hypothetical protein
MKSGSYENNFKSDVDTAHDRILEGLCSFFNILRAKGYAGFKFDKSIIRRDVGDGGLSLGEWDQDFADMQLKKLVEMGKLEAVDLNTYGLTEEGKKHCLKNLRLS